VRPHACFAWAAPVALGALAALGAGCASASGPGASRGAQPTATESIEEARAHTTQFGRVEDAAIEWLVAADPRLAQRAGSSAGDDVLKRIGTAAILAEDTTTQIRGGSLDLFSFQARARALAEAAKVAAAFRDPLPETGPLGAGLARPQLERELLARLIDEERARAEEEASLGDASGDLVRGVVGTWQPPAAPQDVPVRDDLVSRHLTEIRLSLRGSGPRTGPPDLDVALYPLERLLSPLVYPRSSAAIAQLRMALDEDLRAIPALVASERVARAARTHLGVTIDAAALVPRLEHVEGRLRELATSALQSAPPAERETIEARARELLLVERPCPVVPDSRVRSMAPPPERAGVCGALRALTEETSPAAALVALHDDVLFSFAAIEKTPPPRTGLLSHAENDAVDSFERMARERPVVVLGVALAAELLYGAGGRGEDRLQAWRALGEAPLDVVARELQR
jgi:hypothetical protein